MYKSFLYHSLRYCTRYHQLWRSYLVTSVHKNIVTLYTGRWSGSVPQWSLPDFSQFALCGRMLSAECSITYCVYYLCVDENSWYHQKQKNTCISSEAGRKKKPAKAGFETATLPLPPPNTNTTPLFTQPRKNPSLDSRIWRSVSTFPGTTRLPTPPPKNELLRDVCSLSHKWVTFLPCLEWQWGGGSKHTQHIPQHKIDTRTSSRHSKTLLLLLTIFRYHHEQGNTRINSETKK